MRAQCCICSDLFENDDSVNIAAAPCGHTFHEVCLMKWLDTSGTCPSCRKPCRKSKIIGKLFFDADEIEQQIDGSPTKLVNQVADLKVKVRQGDKEKSELIESKISLENKVQNFLIEKENTEKEFRREKNVNTSLKKQISTYESQQKYFRNEQDDYKRSIKQLKDLQHLQVMLSGCESDALEILSQNGEGCTRQLSRYCAILKREYEQTKQGKKSYKDEIDKLRRELVTKNRQLKEQTQTTTLLTEHLSRSEEDLKNTEKEKDLLRKKLSHLKRAVRSPTAAVSSSFIETLTEESPMNCVKTPPKDVKMTIPDKELLLTPDLFDTPKTQTKQHCNSNKMKYVKIVAASDSQPAKRTRTETNDVNDLKSLGSLNIFKKKTGSGTGNFSSTIQKGYDGFGGHTSFTKPLGIKNTAAIRKPKTTSSGVKMFARNPSVQSMDKFIRMCCDSG